MNRGCVLQAPSLPADAVSVLEEGRQAYVSVQSVHGPHVTPELYAWSGGRLWFASASTTLKAKVLPRRPEAGVLVSVPGAHLLLAGPAERYDLRRPLGLAARPFDLPAAGQAMARFTLRNAHDLLAFIGDAMAGRLGRRLPPTRVLFGLRPDRWALVVGDRVAASGGGGASWPTPDDDVAPDPLAGGIPAVAGLPGPIAVPGRWHPDEECFEVLACLAAALPPDGEVPLGVVTDDYAAPGPAAKTGTLVRGWAQRNGPAGTLLRVEAERLVEWDGVTTTSTTAT